MSNIGYIFNPNAINNTAIDKSIAKIFRNKRYFVILQGCRGSGKTIFCQQFKQCYPNIEYYSIDDYYNEMNIEYNTSHIRKSHEYCKRKIKEMMKTTHSIFYNNTNFNEDHFADLVEEAKINDMLPIILRFMPHYDKNDNELVCAHFAQIHHPQIQQNILHKKGIIDDNKKLFRYTNKLKLNIFGVYVKYNKITQTFFFQQCSPHMKILMEEYIAKKIYIPPVNPVKIIKKKTYNYQNNNMAQNNNISQMLPISSYSELSIQEKKNIIQQQIHELEREMNVLNINENNCDSTYWKKMRFKTLRTENNDESDDE
jgi:hypothetical protein